MVLCIPGIETVEGNAYIHRFYICFVYFLSCLILCTQIISFKLFLVWISVLDLATIHHMPSMKVALHFSNIFSSYFYDTLFLSPTL